MNVRLYIVQCFKGTPFTWGFLSGQMDVASCQGYQLCNMCAPFSVLMLTVCVSVCVLVCACTRAV